MILSELIPFLKSIDARPKKSLSQNFLVDAHAIQKIVAMADVKLDETILEIGPGPGALTAELLNRGARVIAVEMDRVFAKELHRLQNGKLTIFEADILEFPFEQLPKNIKIVANLPYHITTPILEKVFASSFSSITIMVQKEVADRMMAQAGEKEFGSLSVFVQFYSQCNGSFKVPAGSFYPQPKVDSTVIRLDSKPLPNVDPTHFFSLSRKAFQQRRKMLTSTLPYEKDDLRQALNAIDIRTDARPENLSLEKWVEFSQFLFQHKKESPLHI